MWTGKLPSSISTLADLASKIILLIKNMLLGHIIRQKSYEKIEYYLHRSGVTFLPTFVLFLILMALPVGLYFLLQNLFPAWFIDPKILPLLILGGSTYYLGIYLFGYAQFIDFYLDSWVVTNDRIVDIDQLGLFAKTVSEMDLYRIQDVTVDIKGFFHTVFNFGNVLIKTASGNAHIIFYNVPNPQEVGRTLIELAEHDRKYHHGE